MGTEREKSYLIIGSEEYRRRFNQIHDRFARLLQKAQGREYKPAGIPGYSPAQEEMLALAFSLVMSPDLLRLSHCNHRAVSASLVQHFDQQFEDRQLQEILDYLQEFARLGAIWRTESGDFLIIHGSNNWFDASELLPDEQLLDCKLMPGSPVEVGSDHLKHLAPDGGVENLASVDLACPKRTLNADCNIIHAEKSVFILAQLLREKFQIPVPEKAFLASTWVPCDRCLGLFVHHRDLIGTGLDVFSTYMALGDSDDETMAQAIQSELQAEHLGSFSGPFIGVHKIAGYGWLPAESQYPARLYDGLQGTMVEGTDQRIVSLLKNALELVV